MGLELIVECICLEGPDEFGYAESSPANKRRYSFSVRFGGMHASFKSEFLPDLTRFLRTKGYVPGTVGGNYDPRDYDMRKWHFLLDNEEALYVMCGFSSIGGNSKDRRYVNFLIEQGHPKERIVRDHIMEYIAQFPIHQPKNPIFYVFKHDVRGYEFEVRDDNELIRREGHIKTIDELFRRIKDSKIPYTHLDNEVSESCKDSLFHRHYAPLSLEDEKELREKLRTTEIMETPK